MAAMHAVIGTLLALHEKGGPSRVPGSGKGQVIPPQFTLKHTPIKSQVLVCALAGSRHSGGCTAFRSDSNSTVLIHPARGGLCKVVDVAIYEAVFNLMESCVPEYSGTQMVRQPSGSTLTGIVPTNTYQCSDGAHVIIGGNGDSIFVRAPPFVNERKPCATS